jgi:hypothetical protein
MTSRGFFLFVINAIAAWKCTAAQPVLTCLFDASNLNAVVQPAPFSAHLKHFFNGYRVLFDKDPLTSKSETELTYSGDDGTDAGVLQTPDGRWWPRADLGPVISKVLCQGDGTCDDEGNESTHTGRFKLTLVKDTHGAILEEKLPIDPKFHGLLLRFEFIVSLYGECYTCTPESLQGGGYCGNF